jgi:HTH-type transcriptional regulator/antitoxin HipB
MREMTESNRQATGEVGEFVRSRRKANGMSQADLAALARVGVRFISELERGKQTVRVDAVNAVLYVFGKRLGIVPFRKDASSA